MSTLAFAADPRVRRIEDHNYQLLDSSARRKALSAGNRGRIVD
jgi:hypothetical protein